MVIFIANIDQYIDFIDKLFNRRRDSVFIGRDHGNHLSVPFAIVGGQARNACNGELRARQPFVWNATSLTPELRRKSVELFEAYQASVRIVFLETGWEEGLRRNRERGKEDPAKMVPEGRIEAMLERMTPPERFEAQQVEWRIT